MVLILVHYRQNFNHAETKLKNILFSARIRRLLSDGGRIICLGDGSLDTIYLYIWGWWYRQHFWFFQSRC